MCSSDLRDLMPLSFTPAISLGSIMEFREYFPVLWSTTMHNFSEDGLGMVCTGGLYMPGRRSCLNGGESHPAFCSDNTRNSRSSSVFEGL